MKGLALMVGLVVAGAVGAAPHTASRAAVGPVASVTGQEPDGRMLYLKNCRTCHGAIGIPSGETKAKYPKIKQLNNKAFLDSVTDDSLLTVLKKGKGKDMKSWADKLTEPEMKAVIAYVRTLPDKH